MSAFAGGMRAPLPEPVAHCAGGGLLERAGRLTRAFLCSSGSFSSLPQPGKVLPVPSAFLPTTGRLVAEGAFSRPPFFLQVSGRGRGTAWVRSVHPSWKGGRYRRRVASRGFPEAIQIVREDGLKREKEECGQRIGLQRLFPKSGRLEP